MLLHVILTIYPVGQMHMASEIELELEQEFW